MTEDNNQIVLDRWNGRPTIYVTKNPALVLHWLMFGHVENFDLWLEVPLSFDEAQDVINNPPRFYDGYIAELSPRIINLHLNDGKNIQVGLAYQTGKSDTPSIDAVRLLRENLLQDTSIDAMFVREVAAYLADSVD